MTLPAEINTCPGVAVDETPSLVGRDRDKGFLRRPRDVYILQKKWKRNIHAAARGAPAAHCLLSSLRRASGLLFSRRGPLAAGLQTPTSTKSTCPLDLWTHG